MMPLGFVNLILALLLFLVVVMIVNMIMRRIAMAPEVKEIAWIIVGVLLFLFLIGMFGLYPGGNGIVFVR